MSNFLVQENLILGIPQKKRYRKLLVLKLSNYVIKTFIIISYALIPILLKILSGCILTKFKFDEIDLQKVQKKLYT